MSIYYRKREEIMQKPVSVIVKKVSVKDLRLWLRSHLKKQDSK